MSKTPETATEDHPFATAIGKALGTIARTTGLARPERSVRKKKSRLPRKLKKALKKKAADGAS